MPSSTSSSSERLPDGNWRRILAGAMLIVAACVATWELAVRHGAAANIPVLDTAELWAEQRARASTLGDRALILVGGSRMQMGVDPGVLAEVTGLVPVQLAMSASPFMPVLEDLASDDAVTGTVLVSFHMGNFLLNTRETKSDRWVNAYRHGLSGGTDVFYEPLENRLRSLLDSALVSFGSRLRPQQLLFGVDAAGYLRTLPDRSQQADYSKTDARRAYERRIELLLGGQPPVQAVVPDLAERLQHLQELVRRIEERGGEVIFVRFPSTRRVLEIDEIRHPRALFWDRFAACPGGRKLHFADYPELAAFDLPDGVHLDVHDQPAFTRALGRLL